MPDRQVFDGKVQKIKTESDYGSFTILPHHLDYVSALIPGLFSYIVENGDEEFLAVDEGILVKCGTEVFVSVRNAIRGRELGQVHTAVVEEFQQLDEREKRARDALLRLESDFIRRITEYGEK